MSLNNTPNTVSESILKYILHFGFLVSGIITVLIGQVLPILQTRLALNDTQAGYLFLAQFSGSIFGTLITQTIVKRFGYIGAIVFGFLAMTIGMLLINSEAMLICLAAFFISGCGIGITLPAINMLTVELNPNNVTPALNFLNFFWGVGAIFCKPFIDFFATPTSIYTPTVILAVLLAATGLAIALAPRKNVPQKTFNDTETETALPIWTTSTAWLIAFFNFVHVGFESGVGGWITTYTIRLPNQETGISWISPTFAYFLFFVAGRLIAPLYSRFLNENKMLLLSLLVTTVGIIVLLLGNNLEILVVGASITGFGTSAIFPTNMARFTKTFGATATRRATPMFISGTLGAAFVTQLIGYVSTSYNNLRVGMFVLLASCLILINLQIILAMKKPKQFPSAD